MGSSSESWEPNQHPHPWHSRAGGGAVHSINRRHRGALFDYLVNLDAKTVEIDGSRVPLTPKEYQMLELLALREGVTLTKEMFLNHLYGGIDEPDLKIIDVYVQTAQKARQRLGRQELHRNRVGSPLRAAAPGPTKNR